jgi:hemoglobin-like flavoprotein
MTDDGIPAEMETTLLAIAETGTDIAPLLFERFLAAFPEQRAAFTNLEAAMGRMTNETVEALMGVASGEFWVPVTITNFVDLHRNYGTIPLAQYVTFVDMVVDTLAEASGTGWSSAQEAAWRAQATRLNRMIADACEGRTPAIPV